MSKEKVTENTRVNVYNNVGNRVIFEDATQNKVFINKAGQYKVMYVRDLRHIMSEAETMLTEGILYIKNKDVREFLGIDEHYKNGRIIYFEDIDKVLTGKPEKVKEAVKKASPSIKKEVGQKAKSKKKDLTVGVVEAIEEETGISLEDTDE